MDAGGRVVVVVVEMVVVLSRQVAGCTSSLSRWEVAVSSSSCHRHLMNISTNGQVIPA